MIKKMFEDEIIANMQKEMKKQASSSEKVPQLTKAAECLHSALEIFEQAGIQRSANQILNVMQKIGQKYKAKPVQELLPLAKIMEAGLTQNDLKEFAKGNPIAKAKVNLVLRSMGLPEHQIAKFIGHHNIVSEEDAKKIIDPNRSFSKMFDWIQNPEGPTDPNNIEPGEALEFKSIAGDKYTKGLTSKKQISNLEDHGTEFNMSDNMDASFDMNPSFDELFNDGPFDIDAPFDAEDHLDLELNDSLEVFDKDVPFEDFEDEKHEQ